MSPINRTTPASTPLVGRAQAVVPAQPSASAQPSVPAIGEKLVATRERIVKALESGDAKAAREAVAEGLALAKQGAGLVADATLKAKFAEAEAAFTEIGKQVEQAASQTQVAKAEPPKEERKGPFSFVGDWLKKGGELLEKGARFVTKPLEWLGKAIAPAREWLGNALGGLKDAIDNSIGKIPVIGQVARFATGLGASVVGMVDGLVSLVTNPVDVVKGLGGILWDLGGVLPPFLNAKTVYDMAVKGMNPLESFQDSLGGTGNALKAMFGGALEDFKAGNYSGALGRLTGDIGSLFLGGAGAARAASFAGKFGKGGAVAARAINSLAKVVTIDAKLMELGAAGAGKLAAKVAKVPGVDTLASKLSRVDDAARLAHADDAAKVADAAKLADEAVPALGGPAPGHAASRLPINLKEGQAVRVQRGAFGQGGAIEADWTFKGVDANGRYVVGKLDDQGRALTKTYSAQEFAALNPETVKPVMPPHAIDAPRNQASVLPTRVSEVKGFLERNGRDFTNATLDGRVRLKDGYVATGVGQGASEGVTFSIAQRGPDGKLIPGTERHGVTSREMVELLESPQHLESLGYKPQHQLPTRPLEPGAQVRVQRGRFGGDGPIEADWKLHGVDESGNVVVKKIDDQGRELTKTFTAQQFAELNPEFHRAGVPNGVVDARSGLDRRINEARMSNVRTLPEGFQVRDLREATVRVPSRSNPEGWMVAGKDTSGNVVVYKEGYGSKAVSPATLALENPRLLEGMPLRTGETVMAAGPDSVRLLSMQNNRMVWRDVPTAQFLSEHADSVAGLTRETIDALPTKEIVNGRPVTYDPVAPLRQNPNIAKLPDLFGGEGRAAINRSHQQAMASSRYNRLSPADQAHVWQLHNTAMTGAEQAMLQRALGSGAHPAQLTAMSQQLRAIAEGGASNYKALGVSKELASELERLTPEQRVLRMTTLEGHQQFFTTSCNPTSFQIVRAELDPLYALDANLNPEKLLAEQHALLQGANRGADGLLRDPRGNVVSEVAFLRNDVPRPQPKRGLFDRLFGRNQGPAYAESFNNTGGQGSYLNQMADQLNAMKERTGLTYTEKRLAQEQVSGPNGAYWRTTREARKQAVRELDEMLVAGKPTEIGVTWRRPDGSPANMGHAIAVIDRRVLPNGQTQFLLHDPWYAVNGKPVTHTQWVSADDLVEGRLGGMYDQTGNIGMLDTILKA